MQRQHRIIERALAARWFVLENVEAGGQNCLVPQRLDQSLLVNQQAALGGAAAESSRTYVYRPLNSRPAALLASLSFF